MKSDAEPGGAMGRHDEKLDRSDPDSLESNARGVFFLLLSVRASLLRLYPEEICLGMIDECLNSLKAKYHLSNEEVREGILWEETSLDALLRLLGYLQAEIDERLNDPKLAERLKLCVDHLRQVMRM